jgi:mono/diheme cytochrome c family protein
VSATQSQPAKARGRIAAMSALGLGGAAFVLGVAGMSSAPRAQAAPKPYAAQCQSCHKADGSGTPGVFPRLSGRLAGAAGTSDGRKWLAAVVLHGQSGPITVDGKPIRAAMPGFKRLPDAELAATLNWVAKGGKPFTPGEIAAVRAEGAVSAAQVGEMRKGIAGQLK